MVKKIAYSMAAVCLVLLMPQVYADNLNYGVVSFSASATDTVKRDLMTATLAIREQGADRQKVSNAVTERSNRVLAALKKYADLNGALTARRILNPRMAVKANIAFGHIHGTSEGFIPTDAYSETPEGGLPTQVKFSRNVMDIGAQFELNFWGFGTGVGYKGNSRITPYILAGAGVTLGMGGHGGLCGGMNIPVGVGVKYKLKPRVNLGFEWTMRFSTTDKLDATAEGTQLNDPYGVKSAMFKNKDCYSFAMFFITYDMFPKLRRCNN